MTRNTSFRAWVIPIKDGRARGLEDVTGNVCTCRSCDVMVMRHQFQQYRAIKEKDTCTMIVDFSENFTCGQNRAIQSSHFGASNKQVTLHRGVAYTHGKTLSFCSAGLRSVEAPGQQCYRKVVNVMSIST